MQLIRTQTHANSFVSKIDHQLGTTQRVMHNGILSDPFEQRDSSLPVKDCGNLVDIWYMEKYSSW